MCMIFTSTYRMGKVHHKYAKRKLIIIVMFALPVIILEKFPMEICMILTLTFSMYNKKYGNQKCIYDVGFDGSSNVCPICHYFRDIHSWNDFDLNHDL